MQLFMPLQEISSSFILPPIKYLWYLKLLNAAQGQTCYLAGPRLHTFHGPLPTSSSIPFPFASPPPSAPLPFPLPPLRSGPLKHSLGVWGVL